MNEKPPCPKCQSIEVVKNGKVQGKQKDKCKSCSLQFTRLTPRGRPAQEKAMAVTLYTLGLSIRAIAGLIGVSPTAVLKWIKTFAKTHYEDFRFDPMDSCLLRVGTRLSYEIFQGFSPYAGVAWEHEFDGTARTELSNHGVDAPSVSMRGDSAVFMAGLQWDPAHSSLHVDLGLEGSAGVRQSVGGQARLVWEF
ncbi:MAG: autotransporter domain-containing protein [Desulfovibrio piger]|uniref:IS1/IS1595 family N-terminal zinc-binding domain-containing protein n=1 Tax=Desulfovibrio piger TaxID=901 RepID=UPI00399C2D12